jgi:hypothetical protein
MATSTKVLSNKVLADLGPAVTKAGRATKATKAILQGEKSKAVRVRKDKVAEIIVLKNPVQVRHLRSEIQPKGKKALTGVDTMTVCGRVVVKQMTRVKAPTGRTVKPCQKCLEKLEGSVAFTPTSAAANKAK